MQERVRVRPLHFEDLPDVMRIEERSFVAPWSLAMFLLEMSKPAAVCLAAEDSSGGLLGYLICSRGETVWHLMNVAVSREYRRRYVASALLDAMFTKTGEVGAVRYTLEVRVSNREAIGMYRRIGFQDAGRRRRYYVDNGEDALIMWYSAQQRVSA